MVKKKKQQEDSEEGMYWEYIDDKCKIRCENDHVMKCMREKP